MDKKNIVKELEEIIEIGLESLPLPIVKGNSIRIKHMVVRKSKSGYLVYDTKTNTQVARTFSKASAIVIAKCYPQGNSIVRTAMDLDQVIQKYYNDAIFYKHTIKKTSDEFTKETRRIRLQDAIAKTEIAKRKLDKYIYGI